MADTTTIRVSRRTRDELLTLANERGQTVADTVSHAIRLLHQDEIGRDLAAPLTDAEISWLDADSG